MQDTVTKSKNTNRRGSVRNPFSPLLKKKIIDEVYDQLISRISQGKLKPGHQLPSERFLATELGVSRQSIREALKKAESKGLIEARHGEGTFILSAVSDIVEPPLIAMLREEAGKIYEFIEIRKVIEAWCARRAAEHATRKEIQEMEQILERMAESAEANETLHQLEIEFHSMIAEAAKNTLMLHLMTTVKQIFNTMYRLSEFKRTPEKKKMLLEQHREILEAIKGKDSALAERKMEAHLVFVEDEWRREISHHLPRKKRN